MRFEFLKAELKLQLVFHGSAIACQPARLTKIHQCETGLNATDTGKISCAVVLLAVLGRLFDLNGPNFERAHTGFGGFIKGKTMIVVGRSAVFVGIQGTPCSWVR